MNECIWSNLKFFLKRSTTQHLSQCLVKVFAMFVWNEFQWMSRRLYWAFIYQNETNVEIQKRRTSKWFSVDLQPFVHYFFSIEIFRFDRIKISNWIDWSKTIAVTSPFWGRHHSSSTMRISWWDFIGRCHFFFAITVLFNLTQNLLPIYGHFRNHFELYRQIIHEAFAFFFGLICTFFKCSKWGMEGQ